MGVGKYDPAMFASHRLVALAVADTGRKVDEPDGVVEPVEVGVTVFDGGRVGATRTWLVRPSRPVTVWATRGHGIDDRTVADAPGLAQVAEQIGEALADRIVVAVRASHGHAMLAPALPDWHPPRLVDLRRLSALVWPWCSQALGAVEIQARVNTPGPLGRARHDAPAVAAVFLALAKRTGWPAERMLRLGTVTEDPAGAPAGVIR
ncbi:MAG TPA: exonuclease domain-containing protein [Mycobacteriales bacterium]|nr:exonuclease domain-containing protein [Mycobacteriales bacterium]